MNTVTELSVSTRSIENFREWLRHEIGKSTDLGLTEVDFSLSINELGMSSVHVVRLAGEIEELLDIEIEPTSFYDYSSISELCDGLLAIREGRKSRGSLKESARAPLIVAATFTAEPMEDTLTHLIKQLGLPFQVQFARYNQVFQELLNPHSQIGSATSGIAVLAVRIEDWFRYSDEPPTSQAVETMLRDFLQALRAAGERSRIPLLLALPPHSPRTVRKLKLSDTLDALDDTLMDAARALPQVQVVDFRHIDQDYQLTRIWDDTRDELGHIPFTQACFTALAAGLVRRCAASVFGPAKVIVLDCDNTLWGGVCGEEGPSGIRTDGPFANLQQFMLAQQRDGKLLCLCSKNAEIDVMAAFAGNPDMPLSLQHIAAHRINWQRKSDNIRELAAELNLGLDSFIFVDDNPLEIEEVKTALPQVLAVQLPAEMHRIGEFLQHHWAFDTLTVTEEDRQRTRMYQENYSREALRETSPTLNDFLEQLQLVVDIAPLQEEDIPRASQLTQRTNQFNAVKRTQTENELRQWVQEDDHHLLRVRVMDRFGDYGMVGLMACRGDAEGELIVDAFMLSCRVLGRGVEHAMVRYLASVARASGCSALVFPFVETDRNRVAQEFYASLGKGIEVQRTGEKEVAFPVHAVEVILAQAVHQQRAPATQDDAVATQPNTRALAASALYDIAQSGNRIDQVQLRAQAAGSTRRPDLPTDYATPRTSWEKKISNIWRDVLRLDRVGIHDSFYALGGDSLRAAEAFARMWDMGVPESISLQTMEDPTVASLCQAIEAVLAGDKPRTLADHFSLADEGQLAPDIRNPGYDVSRHDTPLRRVLVTGTTGYVGAFALYELMKQTDAQVLCLVRASTVRDGRDRVMSNLRRYALETPDMAQRVSIVLGDLTEPRLGLDEAAFKALADDIDAIIHSAAWVNFVYPYQHLKATNVDSTETLLRLATASAPRAIAFHFISTMGVIMSTGYGRETPVRESDALLHADDLLNGYEQSKYASDKMVWTAFKERGIPGAIYRPGLVSGLSEGTYHKLDEFLPQCVKGCLQMGSVPTLDTAWEMAPIDFVSKAIVHIARNPRNLNKAYFVTHLDSQPLSRYVQWHQQAGFSVRSLPWDVWKREFLNMGSEVMRKNAMFPFVDFIRALSEEQVYFPAIETLQFREAIRDMAFDLPPPMELVARYTRHFTASGFYDDVPGVPLTLKDASKPLAAAPLPAGVAVGTGKAIQSGLLDERLRFRPGHVNEAEAYYVLWNDPERQLSMVVRYVLFHGPIQEAQVAEVWCWFLDRREPGRDVAVRQRYSIGRAEILNTDDIRLRIGPCGYGAHRVWGEVRHGNDRVQWDWTVDSTQAVSLERVQGLEAYGMFPHFQSNGVCHHIDGNITVNGHRYDLTHQLASDGHYWDTHHLEAWSWGHCARFDGDDDLLFEGIAARLNDWTQPSVWLTFRYKGTLYTSNIVDSFYFNRETEATLASWRFTAERGDLRFVGTLTARHDEQTLIVHPRSDGSYLYTHITYTGDMQLDIEQRQGDQWWTLETRNARGTAAFEVTRPTRNPAVTREFRIMRAR